MKTSLPPADWRSKMTVAERRGLAGTRGAGSGEFDRFIAFLPRHRSLLTLYAGSTWRTGLLNREPANRKGWYHRSERALLLLG